VFVRCAVDRERHRLSDSREKKTGTQKNQKYAEGSRFLRGGQHPTRNMIEIGNWKLGFSKLRGTVSNNITLSSNAVIVGEAVKLFAGSSVSVFLVF
jgi:carbohydrate-binding DOMON domain-containing protein